MVRGQSTGAGAVACNELTRILGSGMAEQLIQFWGRYTYLPNTLQVHPDDLAWMQQHWPAPLHEPFLDWERYTRSKRFGSRDSDVHLSHLPVPYWGDLRRASVLIFLKNPGFDNTDYYLESQSDFREAHLRNLRQDFAGTEYPFLHLDPRFSWSGSFLWWEQRLRPVIGELANDGLTYLQALRFLSQQIAAVQLFPYRSLDSSRLRWKRGEHVLPSVAAAREFLARRSHTKSRLVLVMRRHAEWHTNSCATPGGKYLHGPRLQGVSFHPRFSAGAAMLKTLRTSSKQSLAVMLEAR